LNGVETRRMIVSSRGADAVLYGPARTWAKASLSVRPSHQL